MRKLSLLILIAFILTPAMALTEDIDFFPMDMGQQWVYDDKSTETIVSFKKIEIPLEQSQDGYENRLTIHLFEFDSYQKEPRTFYRVGQKIFEWTGNNSRLWYDFGAEIGSSWSISWSKIDVGLTSVRDWRLSDLNEGAIMTLVEKNVSIKTPLGEFSNCYHFRLTRPTVSDAGYVDEWFAPGVGCVQRVWDTIAGPRQQKLLRIIRHEPLEQAYRIDVRLDKTIYFEGENIEIEVTVLNWSDKEITLNFPTSLQVDYHIDTQYNFSDNHMFLEAESSVIIPARDVHKWTFTHTSEYFPVPVGEHKLAAELIGPDLKAIAKFIVIPSREDIPAGLEFSLSTGKETYGVGESVDFSLTITNTTGEDITLQVPERIHIWYAIDDIIRVPDIDFFLPERKAITIPANESVVFEGVHNVLTLILKPGDYTLRVGLFGYGEVANTTFSVTRELVYGSISGVVYVPSPSSIEVTTVEGAEVTLHPTIPLYYENELTNVSGGGKVLWFTVSDGEGRFELTNVPLGMFYVLTVTKKEYAIYSMTIRPVDQVTNIEVPLKPLTLPPEKPLNFKKHEFENLIVAFGTERTVYKPDSPFTAFLKVHNKGEETVSFTFDSEEYLDVVIKSPDGTVIWSSSEHTEKSAVTANYMVEIPPGETHVFKRECTFENIIPEGGGKFVIEGALRFTSSSIENLTPEDLTGRVKVIIVPPEAQTVEARFLNTKSHQNELIVDLKEELKTCIDMRMKNEDVTGDVNISELHQNFHDTFLKHSFIKMIEVDVDVGILEALDSATIRIYYDPEDFEKDIDPETLVIAHWHEGIEWDSSDTPEWEGLESRVDTVNNFVEATTESFSSFGLFLSDESTGVSGDGLPSTFTLKQNSPNPFNPTTVIEFSLPEAGYVTLTVYNLTGQEVARLVERSLPAGTHRVIFDGNNYSSGIYFYQFSAPGFTETRKMLLIK